MSKDRISISVTAITHAKVKRMAEQHGISMSDVISRLVDAENGRRRAKSDYLKRSDAPTGERGDDGPDGQHVGRG